MSFGFGLGILPDLGSQLQRAATAAPAAAADGGGSVLSSLIAAFLGA